MNNFESIFDKEGSPKIVQKQLETIAVLESQVLKQGSLMVIKKSANKGEQRNLFLLTNSHLFYLTGPIKRENNIASFTTKAKIELQYMHSLFYTKESETNSSPSYLFKLFKNKKMLVFRARNKHEFEMWKHALQPVTIQNDFFDTFRVLSCLGSGSQAKVYRIQSRISYQQFACKRFKKERLNSKRHKMLLNELSILKKLQGHPNVIDFIGLYESDNSIYIITELCRGGRLTKKRKVHHNYELKTVCKAICKALVFFKSRGIVHRDLKPDNILLLHENCSLQENIPKIIDFGVAVDITEHQPERRMLGTVGYMPPESFSSIYTPDFQFDVFSLGVILYNALTGKKLFKSKNQERMVLNNFRGAINFNNDLFQAGDELCRVISKEADYMYVR